MKKTIYLILFIISLFLPAKIAAQEILDPPWRIFAAKILAGETVSDCNLCDIFIACTLVSDADRYILNGYSPYALIPNRWKGWSENYTEAHLEIINRAIDTDFCSKFPKCEFVGNYTDYLQWTATYASNRMVYAVGNRLGVVVCVPYEATLAILRLKVNGSSKGVVHYE